MTKTKQVNQISLSDIHQFAKEAKNDVRVIDKIEVGQAVRQGDVYVSKIADFDKKEYEISNDFKLAPGNTPGSRHYVDTSVKVWKRKNSNSDLVAKNEVGCICYGPVIEAEKSFKVTHPEHADFYMPAGVYQISYQVDPVQMRRVLD